MPVLDAIVLPLVLWVAASAARSDLRTGRIPNRPLALGFLFGVEASLLIALWVGLGGPGVSTVAAQAGAWGYLGAVYLNGATALLVGFLLWWFGVWAAGDAKLFALLAFLLPHGFYDHNLLAVFPSFVLFFNTFAAMVVMLGLELAYKLGRQARDPARRRAVGAAVRAALARLVQERVTVLRVVSGFIAILLAIRVARHFARELLDPLIPHNPTLTYLVLFVLFTPLMRFLARRVVFYGTLAALVLYAVYAFGFATDPEARAALLHVGAASLLIVFGGWAYTAYVDAVENRALTVADLRPGMVLSAAFAKRLAEDSTFNNERLGVLGPDGLSAHQVETIHTWFAANDPAGGAAPAEVATTVPFAPAMFVAVVLTIVLRGYVVVV